jgi:uncharacterized protein YcbK (DUF882 family)
LSARRRSLACCIAAALLALLVGPSSIRANTARDRTISLYNIHTKETLTVQYMKDGKRIPKAMEQINWILRDWRKDEQTTMDPGLIDLLWEVHNELGSAEPINIISGYRSHDTNEMLRRTVGGQASQSRHILGKAADVMFPDVPIKRLRYSALIHERGGVGYYPTSATPFVHIDTDHVRAWPRLPRMELALLFPSGHTQHIPDDGEPLTRDDVRKARAANPQLVAEVAAFNDLRTRSKAPFQVASLGPSLPQLLNPPRLAERPAAVITRPSEVERARLAALAAEPAPRLLQEPTPVNRRETIRSGELQVAAADPIGDLLTANRFARSLVDGPKPTFVPAPAYDDEHPEELSYRPFPIAPFLTATASGDDPALAQMVHPDFAKTLELLDQPGSALPMRLRPGLQAARHLWAQEFKGEAINLSALIDPETLQVPPGPLANRRVHTQAQ